jgi:hypothetical protein
MLHGEVPAGEAPRSIRELPLLRGEKVEAQFVPGAGSVSPTPGKGPLLVLTSQRLISFMENSGHKETVLALLGELEGVSVKATTRGFRDLSQGLVLVFVGILTYFVLGYILDGVAVALALGAAIAFVGFIFVGKYLLWEEDGSVTFQVGSWEIAFPYRNDRASADLYRLIDRFFQLKLSTDGDLGPSGEAAGAAFPTPALTPVEASPATPPAPTPASATQEAPEVLGRDMAPQLQQERSEVHRPWWQQGS